MKASGRFLPPKWLINFGNNCLFLSEMDKNPIFDIYFNNTLSLFIRVCAWCLPTDHGMYKKYDSSIKNVPVSDFVIVCVTK